MKKLNWLRGTLLFATLTLLLAACSQEEPTMKENNFSSSKKTSTEVTLDEARAELLSLITDIDRQTTRSGHIGPRRISNEYATRFGQSTTRSESADEIPFYVFNFQDNEGFAIMSGDTRLPSLIALANEGNLNEGDSIDNPGLNIFLENLEDYAATETNGDYTIIGGPNLPPGLITYHTYSDWTNTVYVPGGLCKVKWGQKAPYNDYCYTSSGEKAVTCCVATAVAQLMSIYKYPSTYKEYSFDWDSMTQGKTANSCPSKGKDDISTLMMVLGLPDLLNVDYGVGSSPAYSTLITWTLRSLGYSNPGVYGDYGIDKIVAELKNSYPVLIDGKSTKKTIFDDNGNVIKTVYSGGHNWLVHGLMERYRDRYTHIEDGTVISSIRFIEDYLLCNWGWNGSYDGYYLSRVFDRSQMFYEENSFTRADTVCDPGDKEKFYRHNLHALTGVRR